MVKRPFNKRRTFRRLVVNALDFLSKAILELEESPKYSIIHFYAALELFLKARLMAEHWTLILASQKELDLDKFMAGDFRSVSLHEASTRLEKVVRSGFSKQVLGAFDDIRKHRNQIVHFFHRVHSKKKNTKMKQEIVRQQLKAWYHLNKLLTLQWKKEFSFCSTKIVKIDAELRQLRNFLEVVFENLTPEIEKLRVIRGQHTQFKPM